MGAAPLRALFERLARPLATPGAPGAWYRGHRLVSLDGTTLDLPDTPELEVRYGRPGASRGISGFPQLRLLSLAECGTHAVFAAALDRYDVSEVELAPRLLTQLRPGLLCLADRAFVGFALWGAATATGSDLLWRVRANQVLPCRQRLADGSYLSRLYASPKHRRHDDGGVPVRVIDYRLEGVPGAEPLYRLLTTLLDPVAAPAAKLAAPMPRALGGRGHLRRAEGGLARRVADAAQPPGRPGRAGSLWPAAGPPRAASADLRGQPPDRLRPGSPGLPARRAGGPAAPALPRRVFPLGSVAACSGWC